MWHGERQRERHSFTCFPVPFPNIWQSCMWTPGHRHCLDSDQAMGWRGVAWMRVHEGVTHSFSSPSLVSSGLTILYQGKHLSTTAQLFAAGYRAGFAGQVRGAQLQALASVLGCLFHFSSERNNLHNNLHTSISPCVFLFITFCTDQGINLLSSFQIVLKNGINCSTEMSMLKSSPMLPMALSSWSQLAILGKWW